MSQCRWNIAAAIAGNAGFADTDCFRLESAHPRRLAKRCGCRNGSKIVEGN
jgi:hypothetical protein